MKQGFRNNFLVYIIILIAAVALLSFLLPTSEEKPEEISLSEAIAMSQNNEIAEVVLDEDERMLLITSTAGVESEADIGYLNITPS